MKTLLRFLFALSASLAGASFTTGRIPDAALIFASAFVASIATWTFHQYDRKFYPLTRVRPLRPSLPVARRDAPAAAHRRAA